MDGNTPLELALLAKRWDTVLILISKGSVLNVKVTKVDCKWEPTPGAESDADKKMVETGRTTRSALWHALPSDGALATYRLSSAARLPMDTVLSALVHNCSFQKALQQIQQYRNKALICTKS